MVEPSRRSVLLAGAAFAALAACGRSMPGPTQNGPLSDPAEPVPPVHDRIAALQLRHNASIGVYAADPKTGRTISYQDGVPFAMCSTFKTYAVARVLQKSQRGELRLDVPVYIEPAAVVNNSPVTGPHAGGSLPLSALCEAALQRSDNTAANLLLKAVGGPPAITAFARSIGDEMTRLDRWETELNSAIPGDLRDTSTPRALGGGYQRLLTGDVLGAPERKQLEDWMRGSVTSTRAIRAGLPTGWTAADKSGSGDYGSTNDIGIAYGPEGRQVLLAVMARSQSADPNVENLQSLIAAVTTVTLPWLIGSN